MFLDLSRLFAPYTRPGAGAPPTWKPCENARAAFAHIAAIGDGGRSVGPRQTHGWRSPQSRGVSESGGIDPPIRPRSDAVSREQTRVDAASRRLIKPESFPVLTASMGDGPRLGQLGGPIPTLRMLRPHPSDRVICALTWGFVLNTSHRFAWFRSVSRAERAQSCGWARSTLPVHVPAVLHTMDQNNLLVFKDLVDDSVVATSRRPQALEFSHQRLACLPDIGLLVEIGQATSCNVGVEATNTDVLRATGPTH